MVYHIMNQRTPSDDALTHSEHLAPFKQIVVMRSLAGLGDFLCIVPALRSLRAGLPQAKITLVGLANTQALVRRFHHYVDEFMSFPGYPGLPEQVLQLDQIPAFFTKVQNQRFELALQMHGSGIITNPLVMLMGAIYNGGFFVPGQYCPDLDRFLPYSSDESEVRRYLQLVTHLGFPDQGEALEFPLDESDYQALKAIEATQKLHSGQYVCIHPGASIADRRWAPDHFARVADTLAQRGFQIVLTGSSEEVPLTHAVASLMQMPSINLAGCTSLGALAVLLQDACLLVCNDTGVSHLAAALRVPSVVIFTTSNPRRWAPLDRSRHRVICTAEGETLENVIDNAEALLHQSSTSHKALSIALQLSGKGDVTA